MTTADRCSAYLCHGPGHQSKSPCEVQGAHDVHETHYAGGQRARWRTGQYTGKLRAAKIQFNPDSYPEDIGMTGYFDEPPEDDDDGR